MPDRKIVIDGLDIPFSGARPSDYIGVHSGTELCAWELEVTLFPQDDITRMEELLNKRRGTVDDGFAGRQYEATLTLKSSSYQSGRPGKFYRFEVKELDSVSTFEVLEIEGQSFRVIRNTETFRDEVIGIHALLSLSSEEFQSFHRLVKPGPVQMRRLAIDAGPVAQRFGGALHWSLDKESSPLTYKQIVNLFPADHSPNRWSIASAQDLSALSSVVLDLSARYEALLDHLVDGGHLGQEGAQRLKEETRDNLLDTDRRAVIRSRLREIDDAEAHFDWSFFRE